MNSDAMKEIVGNRGMRIAGITVLAFLALFLLVESISTLKNMGRSANPATDVITVSGEGQATLAPDVARISFSVENTAPTVAAAQAATTKQANEAIDFVKGQGVDDKDVRTLSYNITPQYSYPNPCSPGTLCPSYSTPKITGYQVSESVEVKVRDLTKVGELLAGIGKLGVQNVSGPAFALDDSTAGFNAARTDAINKAKAQANQLARELGVSLGKIVNYNESSGGYNYPATYGMGVMAADSKAAVPNLPVGENTYNASVSITYEIR